MVPGRRRILSKNAALYAPESAVPHLFRIEQGVIRLCLYMLDGQRVIVRLAFPGDLVGLIDGQHKLAAEAVTSVIVMEWSFGEDDGATEQRIRLLSIAMRQAYLALAIRSRPRARARVAAFLLELAARGLNTEFRLPLGDLAEHLGVTIHTISRTLTEFGRTGVLRRISGQVFVINKIDRLREIAFGGSKAVSEPHLPASTG